LTVFIQTVSNMHAAAARTTETIFCMIAGEAHDNNNGLNYLLRFSKLLEKRTTSESGG
jgi:hypothetical protein